MSDPSTQPYERLASLIEYELQLVGERRLGELPAVQQARVALQDSLPAAPPASAGDVLVRCSRLSKRVEIELLRVREVLLLEAGQLRRAQRTADGYAPVRATGRRIVARA
ncbi:MAG TPA: hypothetical protein VHX62_04475 [Solirubrobacteraceae bacterium]|jgi:hypothetical protein|nr:hypothetical protein [Solirubrobacteraceae bacterium]